MNEEELAAEVRRRVEAHVVTSLLETLLATPGAWGREESAAEAVSAWLADRDDALPVHVDRFDEGRANLTVTVGTGDHECAIYSHLDTSLTGTDRDLVLTGWSPGGTGWSRRTVAGGGVELVGTGIGVARGPAAAATVGFLTAAHVLNDAARSHRSSLLLAAGGTHRRERPRVGPASPVQAFGDGVRHAVEHGWRPGAVIVAKAGPDAVLNEEPGSAYVDIELQGVMAPAFLRSADHRGLPGHLPRLFEVIETWRDGFVAGSGPGIGREAAVGAVEVGTAEKPDLLPAWGRVSLYLVLDHGDDAVAVARDLEEEIGRALSPDSSIEANVRVTHWQAAGRTGPDAEIVDVARTVTGLPVGTRGWRGSTDGAYIRSIGVDAVRWGPAISTDPADPSRERVDVAVLVRAARAYGEMLVRYACRTG